MIRISKAEGYPYGYGAYNWNQIWTYRRAYDSSGLMNKPSDVNYGDITQENFGNNYDKSPGGNTYDGGYVFLPVHIARNGEWKGGLNITSIQQAEQRAFGFYHYVINTSNQSYDTHFDPRQLVMDLNASDTSIGLSKFPYLRDVKRPYGLFGFKLNHSTFLPNFNDRSESGNYSTGYKFSDRIAIGNYGFDMHLLHECTDQDQYPQYLTKGGTGNVPYFIPFRSIANNVYKNLLFAGKNIAQSFYANVATRLHPSEWTTGIAAGATAFYMMDNHINDTEIVYNQIDQLQALLKSIGQPLEWN